VRIFTVGVGTERGEPIPVRNPRGAVVGYKKDRAGEVVVSRLGEATLKQVAEIGKGRAFRASPAQNEIDALYAEIDAMEKREIEGGFHAHYEDRFHWFAVAAFVLLAAARLLGEKRRTLRPAAAAEITVVVLLLIVCPAGVGADVASEVQAGNAAYARGRAQDAADHYLRALEDEPERPEIQYNLGNALYASRRYADAQAAYGVAATRADSALTEPLSYNLGNAYFREAKYAEAAAAYKQSLRRNPADEDARWNLEIALRKLKKQQQQEHDNKKQDPNQQGKDKNQNQQQEKQDQQQQDQEQGPQGQQDQQQQQQPQPQPSPDQPREGQQEPGEQPEEQAPAQNTAEAAEEMSAAEAARLLEALGNDERRLLKERFRSRGRRVDVEKDW
jgi:Ca-activated chloride channel family protein